AESLGQHLPTNTNPVRVQDSAHRKPLGSRHPIWPLGSGANKATQKPEMVVEWEETRNTVPPKQN
ncbi:MAG: hypothetical protein KIH09_17085, partial [Candidatus Freyarchaeota archaeon]|nr:hypothetical protein [Candidatus Jordarchaeia archaeon]